MARRRKPERLRTQGGKVSRGKLAGVDESTGLEVQGQAKLTGQGRYHFIRDEAHGSVDGCDNRLAPHGIRGSLSLVERYVRHQLSVHLHVYGLRPSDVGPSGDYCASLERPRDGFELPEGERQAAEDLE